MDREETEVLEDWFRYKDEGGARGLFYVLNLNGHLYGRPKFIIDGEHRGFAFDGKTQYAEASPVLADLGQITVDIALKSEGGGARTIFDFGSSPDNCFVLRIAQNGKPEFEAKVSGKTVVTLTGKKALSLNEWIALRVEIDGEKASLWEDGRKIAERASGFRPADVYPPGAEKRNFIAANRNAGGHFKGSLDHLRVYYAVYDDFAKAPAPRRHAPRRVTKEFIETCSKLYEGSDAARAAAINAKLKPQYAFYEAMGKRRGELLKEIEAAVSQAVTEANRKLAEIRQELGERTRELRAEFDKLPETIKKQTEYRKLEDNARQLDTQRRKAMKEFEAKHKTEKNDRAARQRIRALAEKDPEIARLTREINKYRAQARALRPDPRRYAEQRTVELRRQVAKAEIAVRDAAKQNTAERKPEYDWLTSLGWLAFSRHYNYPYRSYLQKRIGRTVGGKICHENFGSLKSMLTAQTETKWHTQCDWEWRLKKELDGSIEDLPKLQEWLTRVRGIMENQK
ncbi:MAG: hypothetical protein QGG42_06615 [Phycisphaerae bacterium]|nr:hypothetical protein [Phycisphaerae bacterium]